jgi:hypothetical protein
MREPHLLADIIDRDLTLIERVAKILDHKKNDLSGPIKVSVAVIHGEHQLMQLVFQFFESHTLNLSLAFPSPFWQTVGATQTPNQKRRQEMEDQKTTELGLALFIERPLSLTYDQATGEVTIRCYQGVSDSTHGIPLDLHLTPEAAIDVLVGLLHFEKTTGKPLSEHAKPQTPQ